MLEMLPTISYGFKDQHQNKEGEMLESSCLRLKICYRKPALLGQHQQSNELFFPAQQPI
jgi:hypothetical protein